MIQTNITSDMLAETAIAAICNKKGEQIVKLDMRKADGAVCDYFIVCQADNPRQVLAIADETEDFVRENIGEKPLHIEGRDNAQWIILDYVNVVVHVFLDEAREFYKLENLWADAKKTNYQQDGKPIE